MPELNNKQKELIKLYHKVGKRIADKKLEYFHINYDHVNNSSKMVRKNFKAFIKDPTQSNFREFWKREYIWSAQQGGNPSNLLKKNGLRKIKRVMVEIDEAKKYDPSWEVELGARSTLRELWGKLKSAPMYNGCSGNALEFFGYKRPKFYNEFIGILDNFKRDYLDIVKKKATTSSIEIELDQLFNFIDKASIHDFEDEYVDYEEKNLLRMYELKLEIECEEIVNSEIMQDWIPRYLAVRNDHAIIPKEDGYWTEGYKWQDLPAANKKLSRTKITSDNVLKKIEIIDEHKSNLVNYRSTDDLKIITEKNPEKIADMLQKLHKDDGKSLLQKIIEFDTEYKQLNKKKSESGHSLGAPLFGLIFAIHDYNKYPPFKGSTLSAIKKLLGKEDEWKFSVAEKYVLFTYLSRAVGKYLNDNNLLKDAVPDDTKETVRPGIEALDGQDCLYIIESLMDPDSVNFWWVNQGDSYKEVGKEFIWAPKEGSGGQTRYYWDNVGLVRAGDVIFHYVDGEILGVSIATNNGHDFVNDNIDKRNNDGRRADLRHYEIDPINRSVLQERMDSFKEVLKEKYGPFDTDGKVKQGYLFELNKAAAQIVREVYGQPFPDEIEKLIGGPPLKNKYWTIAVGENAQYWDEFYDEGIVGIDWREADLGDLTEYSDKDKIKKELVKAYKSETSQKNNALACYDFSQTMKKGDHLFVKGGTRGVIGYGVVESDYRHEEDRENNKHIRDVRWIWKGRVESSINLNIKTLTDVSGDKEFITYILKSITMTHPLNQILYGPPGTGKTFRAMQIAEELLSGQTKKETKEERTEKIVIDLGWKEILGVVMKYRGKEKYSVPDIAKDEIAQAKKRSLGRTSKINPTLWGVLQHHGNLESETIGISERSGLNLFDKDEESRWYLTEEGEKYFEDYDDVIDNLNNVKPREKDWQEYCRFITFHQSYSYEDFIEGIRPLLADEGEGGKLRYTLKPGVFKTVCKAAEGDPSNNYVLIIDEINRGNISKIFGELITLVELDKRLGGDHPIETTLPYSKDKFGVPSNLYVIGTMNTADRSIALLDAALRRRFKFKEIAPDLDLAAKPSVNKNYKKMDKASKALIEKSIEAIKKINQRISEDRTLGKDKMIGHSYLFAATSIVDIYSVWQNDILPLLDEYCYGREDRKKKILVGDTGESVDLNNIESLIEKIIA